MAGAWLGFVDPIVDDETVALDGPDPIGSAAYAADYNEVRGLGSRELADRTERADGDRPVLRLQPVAMYRERCADYLDEEPLGLLPTTRLFARDRRGHGRRRSSRPGGSSSTSASGGRSRPSRTQRRRQPATEPQPGWAPCMAKPAYSDYTSGHARRPRTFAEVLRLDLR